MRLSEIYGNKELEENARLRIKKLKAQYIKNEKTEPTGVFSSSGRAEVLGNHTDHNRGKVIVAAISCDIIAVCGKRDDKIIKICSENFPAVVVDFNDISPLASEYGTSHALARGVAAAIIQKGYDFQGFTAYTNSNIFKGAGVSSSAAFELLVCEIINDFYLNSALSPMEKARIAQYAENIYFGKPCGILDQSGIALGGFNMLDFADPEKPIIEKLIPPSGYGIVITNTGGDHAKLTDHYAAIRSEMHKVAEYFGKSYLREIDKSEFLENAALLKQDLDGRPLLRALHFYNENERVDKAAAALNSGDVNVFLECVNGSGDSSLTMLQNCYVPGDTNQPIPFATQISKEFLIDGAVRIHGGGFAGTVIAFVKNEQVKEYEHLMKNIFGTNNVFLTGIRPYGTMRIE